MKTNFIPLTILCVFLTLIFSCSGDEEIEDAIKEATKEITAENLNPEEGDSGEKDKEKPESPEVPGLNNTLPCKFKLAEIPANTTQDIACTIDLQGQNVTLANNVTLSYKGGKIINGTLNFSSAGVIDGELLDISLKTKGDLTLSKPEFDFYPEKWNITRGKVSDKVAQTNKENIQNTIDLSKKLGAKKFSTHNLDAYIKIGLGHGGQKGLSEDGIHLPSNFELDMTDNTTLRVQPNRFPWSVLLSTYDADNVIVKGGALIGDRYEHQYGDFIDGDGINRKSHGWPVLLLAAGSRNITFYGITMRSSTGDGFVAGAAGFRTRPGTPTNYDITLEKCVIDDCRRNNISLTDGNVLKIIDNKILNAGLGNAPKDGTFNSAGVNPRYGLDVEPYVEYGSFNLASRVQYEWVEDVTIERNEFKGNFAGSLIVYSGDNVTVDNNTSDHAFSMNETVGSVIKNNILKARKDVGGRPGIETSDFRRYVDFNGGRFEQYAIGNDVVNNTVEGFGVGLRIRGGEADIMDNTITNCEIGLLTDRLENARIHNNKYNSTRANSTGIILGSFANNVRIYNEEFNIKARYLFVNGLNKDLKFGVNVESYEATIENCTFKGGKTSRIFESNGVILKNNTINTGTEIIRCSNTDFIGNTVNAPFVDGVTLDGISNSIVRANNITVTNDRFKKVVQKNIVSNTNTIEP